MLLRFWHRLCMSVCLCLHEMESKIELGLRREECGMTLDVAAYRECLWKLTKLSLFSAFCVTDFFSFFSLGILFFFFFFYTRVLVFSFFWYLFVFLEKKSWLGGTGRNFLDEEKCVELLWWLWSARMLRNWVDLDLRSIYGIFVGRIFKNDRNIGSKVINLTNILKSSLNTNQKFHNKSHKKSEKRNFFASKNNSRRQKKEWKKKHSNFTFALDYNFMCLPHSFTAREHHESAEFCTTMAQCWHFYLKKKNYFSLDLIHEISMINLVLVSLRSHLRCVNGCLWKVSWGI